MKKLLVGILVGIIISLFGSEIFRVYSREYSYSSIGIFIGIILLAIGTATSFVHIIAMGVKLGNDLSKK